MSASPAPSMDPESAPKTHEQITFRFCRECSNMLYPKEDRLTSKLMFACRTCQFSEEAQSSCVFRNQLYNTVGETAGVTQDVGSDPTVRCLFNNAFCHLCGVELDAFAFEEDLVETHVEDKKASNSRGFGNVNMEDLIQMEEEEMDEEGEPEMEQIGGAKFDRGTHRDEKTEHNEPYQRNGQAHDGPIDLFSGTPQSIIIT